MPESPHIKSQDKIIITEPGVLSLLLNLDPKKSTGPDDTPYALLTRYGLWVAKYLVPIFSKSLNDARFPKD